MSELVKTLLIDDSPIVRNKFSKILMDSGSIEVVGTTMNGQSGLNRLKKESVDIILLDVNMPVMSSVEFLEKLEMSHTKIPVILLSTDKFEDKEMTLEALSIGGVEVITKPDGNDDKEFLAVGEQLIKAIKKHAKKSSQRALDESLFKDFSNKDFPDQALLYEEEPYTYPSVTELDVVAIGVSTGGPNALREVLSSIPATFPLPILIVQHMPFGFTSELARSLNKVCSLNVKESQEGDFVVTGNIYIAPGNKHLAVKRINSNVIITSDQRGLVNGHCPSAGVLFESVAEVYGNRALAVIMTGMGNDGSKEIGYIFREGGITIAQDEESSTVFGMPKVAIERKVIRDIVPLGDLAKVLTKYAKKYCIKSNLFSKLSSDF